MADTYFDDLETRSTEERHAAQMNGLARQVERARELSPYFVESLRDADIRVDSLEALALLPVLRKSDLVSQQRDQPPFGGLAATPVEKMQGLYMSPGPIADPQGGGEDWWRMARALYAAGVRPGDRVLNCYSYHHTPAGAMFASAAQRLGCPVYPGGPGQTAAQAAAIQHFRLTAYVGTPDFLQTILDLAIERGIDVSSLCRAAVSGGPLTPPMRERYAEQGIDVVQSYGTADAGLIAYESSAREGLIVDEAVILEIVRPGTGDPLPDGEVGEVVVTVLNDDYPLIRLATGDLSAILPGTSPCGRTAPRIRGWLGRADQATKVKGMFVRPEQITDVIGLFPSIRRARLVVSQEDERDVMTLRYSAPETVDEKRLVEKLREVTRLRGTVELAGEGLPNDGKVIDDLRPVAS